MNKAFARTTTNGVTVTDGQAARKSGSQPAQIYRWVTIGTAVLIVVQALLIGRGWFKDAGLIETHGIVGNVTFLAAVAVAFLALTGLRSGVTDRIDAGLAIAMALLVFAQVGLGYGGRESATAASLHVPNGVLIMGLVGALVARAFPARRSVGG